MSAAWYPVAACRSMWCCCRSGPRHIGPVGGRIDSIRAANRAAQGRSIIALQSTDREPTRSLNMGTLVGSYGKVAAMLDEAAEMPGVKGIMLTFDDFLAGMDDYGTRIQPLMRCRKPMPTGKNPE